MSKRLFTAALGDPPALAALVAARLALPLEDAEARVTRGSVYVDGRRTTDPRASIALGSRVTVFDSPHPIAAPPPVAVVFRDDWLLILEKPPGLPSQATRADSADALDALARAIAPAARPMHRLDRDASGLVLFAARASACAPLQSALTEGRIDRRYLAIVAGRLGAVGETGQTDLRIGRHPHDARLRVAHAATSTAGQPARSRYCVLGHGDETTAVALELETGRTHQLRVHLSAIGHPIVGDRHYGGPPAARLCLHAHRLTLPHPRDGRSLTVTSPPPPELLALAPSLTNSSA